jgi:hypothetical protein
MNVVKKGSKKTNIPVTIVTDVTYRLSRSRSMMMMTTTTTGTKVYESSVFQKRWRTM